MKKCLTVSALVLLVACQRPVTDPAEFTALCGPAPTQQEAVAAAGKWVATELGPDGISAKDVAIVGRADRRFGVMNLGARRYGWKITFHITRQQAPDQFSDLYDILWNNGTVYTGSDGF
jgi:hypothetical protein